jgi:hypothetical protein
MSARKKKERVLVMRTCAADMSSSRGFVWPESGPVACSDWSPVAECGNGLHGLLWGAGDGSLLDWSSDAKWLIVSVDADCVVDLRGKVKFPAGEVVHCGDRLSATTFISADPRACAVVGGTATAGDSGTATAGYRGTATAGDRGTATAGDRGTATAGEGGTATAGYGGTATAGEGGTATAGYGGELRIRWYSQKAGRYRTAIAYVGERGIKPNVAYRLDDNHEFVEVTP